MQGDWAASRGAVFSSIHKTVRSADRSRDPGRPRRFHCASCWLTTTTASEPCFARRSRLSTSRSTRLRDAAVARQRIAAARPDAIVLDVGMPGLDGLGFCRAAEGGRVRPRDIPVVLLTGSDVANEATAQEVGADALLLKPFSPLELLGGRRAPRGRTPRVAVPRAAARGSPASSCCSTRATCATCSSSSAGSVACSRRPITRRSPRSPAALESKDTRYAASTRSASSATRWSSRDVAAPEVADDASVGRTASCSTTSARSGSPTGSCRSPAPLTEPGAAPDADAHHPRRADARAASRSCRAAASRSSARTTSAGTAGGTRTASPATEIPIGGAHLRGGRRARRDDERPALPAGSQLGGGRPGARRRSPAGSSTRRSSTPSARGSARCGASGASSQAGRPSSSRPSSRAARSSRSGARARSSPSPRGRSRSLARRAHRSGCGCGRPARTSRSRSGPWS